VRILFIIVARTLHVSNFQNIVFKCFQYVVCGDCKNIQFNVVIPLYGGNYDNIVLLYCKNNQLQYCEDVII